MAEDASHITQIELSAYRKHAQLTVKNVGRFTMAKGGNDVGKTSALCQSIVDLVSGVGDEAIRSGNKATILVSIGTNVRARRVINGSGNGTLKIEQRVAVVAGEEEKWLAMPEPKTYLLKLLGACSFDPLGWSRSKGEDRKRDLLGMVKCEMVDADMLKWGVRDDVLEIVRDEIDGMHPLEAVQAVAKLYEDWRRDSNREAKTAAEALRAAAVDGLDAPRSAEEIADAQRQAALDRETLVCQKANALGNARAIAGHEATAKAARERAAELDEEAQAERALAGKHGQEVIAHTAMAETLADKADAIVVPDTAAIEAEIDRLKMQLAGAQNLREKRDGVMRSAQDAERQAKHERGLSAQHAQYAEDRVKAVCAKRREEEEAEAKAEELRGGDSPEDLETKLAALADEQTALTAEAKWRRARNVVQEKQEAASALDATLKTLRTTAVETLNARAKMPIKGLSIGANDVELDGVQVSALSTSRRLRLGIDIAKLQAGPKGVILLDEMGLLDAESRATLIEETRGDGHQYLATCVEEGPLKIVDADAEATEPKTQPIGLPE